MSGNPTLRDLFYQHEGKLIHKWDHYFDIYERYFSAYRGKPVAMLEIGISHGGSMQLWKKYFGPQLALFSIDINPECKTLEEEGTKVFIGSQSDPEFLRSVLEQLPPLDIILDDGGHTMEQQIISFEMLYHRVKEGGLYLVEDTHTSYWKEFHGGLRNPGSFIEYSKHLVDTLYEDHVNDPSKLRLDDRTRDINGISFYDSIVVFEKLKRSQAFHIRKGEETIRTYIPIEQKQPGLLDRLKGKLFGKAKHSFDRNDRGKVQ
jgi:cephalosporin hydroxylase